MRPELTDLEAGRSVAVADTWGHRQTSVHGGGRVWRTLLAGRFVGLGLKTNGGRFTGLGLKTRAEVPRRTDGTWRHRGACVETKRAVKKRGGRRMKMCLELDHNALRGWVVCSVYLGVERGSGTPIRQGRGQPPLPPLSTSCHSLSPTLSLGFLSLEFLA